MTPDAERAGAAGDFDVVLVLGGGNALGAFEAGVYEVLHNHAYTPDRLSGASIRTRTHSRELRATGRLLAGRNRRPQAGRRRSSANLSRDPVLGDSTPRQTPCITVDKLPLHDARLSLDP
ncbi:hypothetical protein [Sphingomonas faeni]|uniref:hypothetical protein n=1 Tax=Sphingomonas faeni TaxID=185950 RepID=UPI003362D64D